MVFASVFAITVGLAMIIRWAMLYTSKQIPELETEPIRLWFHVAGEMVTALLLVSSGIGQLANRSWATTLYPIAIGMLLYTAIVSPGYFAQRGERIWVLIFGVIVLLAIVSVFLVAR
jgi:hypothetical protein